MEKHSASVKQINWIDKAGLEAEVQVEVGGAQLWAFCHPCSLREGETAEVYFHFIQEAIPEFAFWNDNAQSRKEIRPSENNKLRYCCYGQIKRLHPMLVDCGAVTLCFGDWLNDESVMGVYVYFVISRLDVQKVNH